MAVADQEAPMEAGGETLLALIGYRNAMTYVLQLSDDPHFAYSRGLIKSLHCCDPGEYSPEALGHLGARDNG
jgi:hypothetical protein